jgi:hypothetical protein
MTTLSLLLSLIATLSEVLSLWVFADSARSEVLWSHRDTLFKSNHPFHHTRIYLHIVDHCLGRCWQALQPSRICCSLDSLTVCVWGRCNTMRSLSCTFCKPPCIDLSVKCRKPTHDLWWHWPAHCTALWLCPFHSS